MRRSLLPILLPWLAGCTPDREDSAETGDSPTDTGDTPTDTGTPAPTWPPWDPTPAWTSDEPGYGTGAAFVDIDGQEPLDLVVANGNDMDPGPVLVYLAASDGTLPPTATWRSETEAYYGHLAVGDVDGDGWQDVVVARFLGEGRFSEAGGVDLYHNEGGTLSPTPTWRAADPFFAFSVALGDIDADGDLDLAATAGEPYQHDPGLDRLFLNEAGTFAEPPAWTPSTPAWSLDVAFVDADGNGALDLVFARQGDPHALFLSPGGGALPDPEPAWEAPGTGFEGNTVDWGDVNGDGAVDLAISDNDQMGGSGRVSLFCGPSLDRCWQSTDPPDYQSAVALRDVDGDDDLDLVAGAWWGAVRVYRNDAPAGDALPGTEPAWTSETDTVVEAFAFDDRDGSHTWDEVLSGPGPLLPLPADCHVVDADPPGAVGDRYFTAPTSDPLSVTCRRTRAPDLLVTDWTRTHGDDLFLHRAGGR